MQYIHTLPSAVSVLERIGQNCKDKVRMNANALVKMHPKNAIHYNRNFNVKLGSTHICK